MDNSSLKKYLESHGIIISENEEGLHLCVKDLNLIELRNIFISSNIRQEIGVQPLPNRDEIGAQSLLVRDEIGVQPILDKKKDETGSESENKIIIKKKTTLVGKSPIIIKVKVPNLDEDEDESEDEIIMKKKKMPVKTTLSQKITIPEEIQKPIKKLKILPKNTVEVKFSSLKQSGIKSLSEMKSLTKNEIDEKRNKIWNNFMNKFGGDQYIDLEPKMIAFLIDQYNTSFFDSLLSTQLTHKKLGMLATANNLSTKTAGCEKLVDDDFIIEISTKVINSINGDNVHNMYANKNTPVDDRIDALMEIVEHELIHVMNALDPQYNELLKNGACELATSHNQWYIDMVQKLFGHDHCRHGLVESAITSHSTIIPQNEVRLGLKVSFSGRKDEIKTGTIIKLNPKKAKVLVREGETWSVPYRNLYHNI